MCCRPKKFGKHVNTYLKCKVYSQKFENVKIWDLNRPLVNKGRGVVRESKKLTWIKCPLICPKKIRPFFYERPEYL